MQGAAHKCDMCGLKKLVLPGSSLARLAGTPATAGESLRHGLSPVAAGGGAAQEPAAPADRPTRQPRQRKMSGGGSSGGKRRRVGEQLAPAAAAAVAAPAAPPVTRLASPAPLAAEPAVWADRSGAGWVLLGSGLPPAARQQLAQLAAASGAAIAKEWSAHVTHVVCGGTNGAAK